MDPTHELIVRLLDGRILSARGTLDELVRLRARMRNAAFDASELVISGTLSGGAFTVVVTDIDSIGNIEELRE